MHSFNPEEMIRHFSLEKVLHVAAAQHGNIVQISAPKPSESQTIPAVRRGAR